MSTVGDEIERFDLPDGRTIVIRPTSPADGEHLCELYDSLTPDDRRLRFFGTFHPSLDWCRSWAGVAGRGGHGVIALVEPAPRPEDDASDDDTPDDDTPDDDTPGDVTASDRLEVAGEAGYAIRRDGDGEFAITVAAPWRGWLGSYLLDRLIRHAAAAGIPNLQADVRLGNGPMLAILGRRDPVAFGHDDGSVHLSVGTATPTATWPRDDDRPRVLVSTSGMRWSGERAAEDAGLATVMCPGPARRRRSGCPVLEGDRCPLADGADVIVVMLDPDDEDTIELIAAHRRMLPGTPILSRRRSSRAGGPGDGRRTDGDVGRTPPDDDCIDVALSGPAAVAQLLALVGLDESDEPTGGDAG